MKFNQNDGIKEPRILAITRTHLNNIRGTKVKRAIKLTSIIGLSKSKSESNLQFVVHVKDEYDYRFEIKDIRLRDELFNVILKAAGTGSLISVYSIPEDKNLRNYTATKRDVLKGL